MSSPSNDIYSDLRELLGTDTLTPDMERVISVMRSYHPRIDIDANYRRSLRDSILTSGKKTAHTRPSWFAWMGWVGTSFAALIVTLGVVRVVFPERSVTHEYRPPAVEFPLPDVATLMQDATPDTMTTSEIGSESQNSEPLATSATTPMTRMTDVQTAEPIESTLTTPVVNNIPPDMSADASMGGGYMMMATPETTALAKTTTPITTESPSPDATSDISSEIQDMVWEINAIINEAGSNQTLTLPDYPTEMPIYTKDAGFTTEEALLLAGSGITSMSVTTYSPDRLESLIIDLRGDMTLIDTPEIRYISYKKGNQSILVPTVIYMTSIGTSLEIALVPGY